MKRGQRTCDSRPEAARRREPRSKIEAKLQLRRRSNLDAKTKRSAEESPRTPRGKLAESSESLAASSSGNEDCPRFFTSKQRVELVDFEPARISRLPRVVSAIKRSEGAKDGSSRTREDRRGRKTWKSSSQTLVKRTTNLVRGSLSEPHLRQSKKLQINFFSPGIGPPKTFFEEGGKCIEISLKNSHNSIRQLAPQEFHDSSTERRSRSAPSTPLFRIKYAKDKRPKNFLAERKSLAERSLREEIRISRKNRSRGLRLSRSSDVTVSSCDAPPSEQKIIESTTLQDSETREEEPETIFTVENRALEENEEGESLSRDNCEAAETAGCRQEVAIKVIDSEKKLPEDAIIAEENSPAIENLHTNPEILETANIADPVEERKQPVEENANVVSRVLAQEKKEISPRKPPKKRAFKWETILEKQHRQQATLYTQSRENSPTTLRENQEERKSNFWNERTANCSKHCRCPKSRGKSSESKRLEAYSRIREELPKILMKRRHAEAEKRAGKLSQAAKSINMSPERPKQVPEVEKFKFDFLLNENFIGHDDYRYNTRSKRSPVERTSPKISNNVSTNCDLPQKLQIPKDSLKITAEEKKNESYSVIADSSQNCRESVERKCMKMPRASILKHRKTPSPRRVTFLLPGRVMHEHLTEDESLVVESSSDKEGAECCARQNVESEKEDEKIFSEEERSAVSEEENLSRDNSQRRDGNPGAHIMEKAERIRPDNLTKTIGAERSEKARNVGWSSLLAAKEDENERESDDSEQDWETPTAEDPHRSVSDVSFPRETRQAMKILQRARDDSSRHHCRKGTTEREIFQQRNLHPKPENSPETSSTLVAESYARVLAMFQEGCDARESSSRATSSQIRGSRRANEAGGK